MHVGTSLKKLAGRRWVAVGAALALGAGLAGAVPALAAVGQESPPSTPIIVGARAPIVDRGAAAIPWAYVACPSGQYAFLNVTLSERVGKRIASGYGTENFVCTGGIETVKVPVTPQYAPFVAGKAFAQVELYAYPASAEKNRTITLYVKTTKK